MTADGSASRSRIVRARRDSLASLAELDKRLLSVLCAQRVVTQEQLCRLFPAVPERTLRYRTRRLNELGLAGRSRPYRSKGSAPNHHWPTRRADCLMRGDPLPRGGERREPNPLFLAHAAALTDLYVALVTEGNELGLRLHSYLREEEAREPFNGQTKSRSLAPDVLLILTDGEGRRLWAFVEMDLGTMSHTRLRRKAALYVDYFKAHAWRERHPFMPALIFLTTTDSRADKFRVAIARMLHGKHGPRASEPAIVAGAIAWRPRDLVGDPCLVDLNGNSRLTLPDVLNAAREPYERARAAQREREQAEAAELAELLANPEAIRERLRRHKERVDRYLSSLGAVAQATIALLLDRSDPADADERAALTSVARDLGSRLLEPWAEHVPEPSSTAALDIKLLAEHYRRSQERLIETLARRYGQGPSLRRAHATLKQSPLLEHRLSATLPADAERDLWARTKQQERRVAYEEGRERTARRLARDAGPLGRLTHRREEFYPELDRKHLKVCRRCEEIIYPDLLKTDNYGRPCSAACHYCGEQHWTRPYDPDQYASKESEAQP